MIASKNKWRLKSPLSNPESKPESGPSPVSPRTVRPATAAPWQPRFGLGTLMLVLLVCAMTAAGGRYLIQAIAGTSSRAIFVIFVLVVPVALLIMMNLVRLIISGLAKMKRRK